jgi:hypothetical protein
MTQDEFVTMRNTLNELCESTLINKGREYTIGSSDKLENFKSLAIDLGLDPLQVWAVYWKKHVASILSYVKDGKAHSEPIEMRFVDCRNYLDLGIAIIKEKHNG